MKEKIAEYINTLGAFCGKRDLSVLSREELQKNYGFSQVDVMVLFGGSILCGGDVLAQAMESGLAKKYIIVGGAGHTTEALRVRVHEELPWVETAGKPEAEVFEAYLEYQYNKKADFLECASTNCGNNITYLLELLERQRISFQSILLVQDASMQRRMEAGLQKYAAKDVCVINYAAYRAEVEVRGGELVFSEEIKGMWDMERYLTLLMGEIPRLADKEGGYGPRGKGYIAHVEIPEAVQEAFEALKKEYPDKVRPANPLFAGRKEA